MQKKLAELTDYGLAVRLHACSKEYSSACHKYVSQYPAGLHTGRLMSSNCTFASCAQFTGGNARYTAGQGARHVYRELHQLQLRKTADSRARKVVGSLTISCSDSP